MKKVYIYSSILLAGALSSCVSESPFSADGEGALRMKMVVKGDITRAENDADVDLAANCKILISKADKGLIHKYDGVSSIPDRLVLSTGSYVAEGYAGDSVSASWDKKFYKGRREFQIQSGGDTQVELVCGIANVVAAIDSETLDPSLIKNWKLTVGHSRAELEFNETNINDKAYFMMPSVDWNSADGSDVGTLNWTITGTDGNGKAFDPIIGKVEHVKPAHQYTFNVHLGSSDAETLGGSFISISVDEKELLREEEIIIYGAPVVSIVTEGFDIDSPVSFAPEEYPGEFLEIGIKTHNHPDYIGIDFSSAEDFGVCYSGYDLLGMSGDIRDDMLSHGITISLAQEDKIDEDIYVTRCISISKAMLDRLPKGKHWLKLTVRDQAGKITEKVLDFLVNNAKVLVNEEPLIVRSYSAQMAITIADKEVMNPGVRYRVKGSQDDWKVLMAQDNVVTFAGLTPATPYEVQAIADDYVNEISVEFTTEGIFQIPNASFEEWGTSDGVIFPGTDSANKFWDTGNQGAKIAGSVITDKSTDMVHSGTYSAKLTSIKAAVMGIGKLAAGNVFTGSYDKTSGTNGELTFGRQFDGTHPVALSGYANYRPGTVDEGKSTHIAKGETDQGQIYVALTTKPVQIKTADLANYSFNPQGDYIIAYGEVTWNEGFGDDGTLKKFEIKLNYVAGKEEDKPSHLVIVASSSKFGDYFEGSTSSVMYLDDFELVYE